MSILTGHTPTSASPDAQAAREVAREARLRREGAAAARRIFAEHVLDSVAALDLARELDHAMTRVEMGGAPHLFKQGFNDTMTALRETL